MMPLLHCSECHHEFEGHIGDSCDWCGADSYELAQKTGVEMLIDRLTEGQS